MIKVLHRASTRVIVVNGSEQTAINCARHRVCVHRRGHDRLRLSLDGASHGRRVSPGCRSGGIHGALSGGVRCIHAARAKLGTLGCGGMDSLSRRAECRRGFSRIRRALHPLCPDRLGGFSPRRITVFSAHDLMDFDENFPISKDSFLVWCALAARRCRTGPRHQRKGATISGATA